MYSGILNIALAGLITWEYHRGDWKCGWDEIEFGNEYMNKTITLLPLLLVIGCAWCAIAAGERGLPTAEQDTKSRLMTTTVSIDITKSINVAHLFRLIAHKAGVEMYLHECRDGTCVRDLPFQAADTNLAMTLVMEEGNARLKFKAANVSCYCVLATAARVTGLKFSIVRDGVVLHIPPVEFSQFYVELNGGPISPPFVCGTFSGGNGNGNAVSNQASKAIGSPGTPQRER